MENSTDRSERLPPPGIAVDGQRIRAIREEKKLTQLYVASVVGVTTDTISRWENNRYPSIKRENAEKLATALEVGLAEIVRQEEPAPPAAEAPPVERWPRLLLTILVVAAVTTAGFLVFRLVAPPLTAVRWLPRFTSPGEAMPVQIKVIRKAGAHQGFIIRERLPDGWRFVAASPAPAPADVPGREISWLIPGGDGQVTISYTVQPPANAPQQTTVSFSGSIVVHRDGTGRSKEIGGQRDVAIAPYHWADRNGDGRIDDNEIMPAYYLTEEMKGLGLDWKTIETIWSAKGYRWNGVERRFIPVN